MGVLIGRMSFMRVRFYEMILFGVLLEIEVKNMEIIIF